MACRFPCGDGERRATEAEAFFLPLPPPPPPVLHPPPTLPLSPSSSASSGAASSRAWRMRRRGSSTGAGDMASPSVDAAACGDGAPPARKRGRTRKTKGFG